MARRTMIRARSALNGENGLFVDAALAPGIVKLIGKLLAPRAEPAAGRRIRRDSADRLEE